MRKYLAVHAAFTYPPRDKLTVLRSEVNYDNVFLKASEVMHRITGRQERNHHETIRNTVSGRTDYRVSNGQNADDERSDCAAA